MLKKRWLLVIAMLLLFTTAGLAQSFNDKVAAMQQQRFTAMINKDIIYLQKCTDTGLVYIHSNGLVQHQQDFIQSISAGSIVYQQIQSKEQQIRVYKKAAIINGIVHVKGMLNGNNFEIDLRYTDAYIYKKGWKMVAWQSLKL